MAVNLTSFPCSHAQCSLHVDWHRSKSHTINTSPLSTLQAMRGSVGLDLRRSTDDLRVEIGRGMSRLQTARSGTRFWNWRKYVVSFRPYGQVLKIITCEGKSNHRTLSCTSSVCHLTSAYRAKAASARPTRPAPELPSLTLAAAPVWMAPVEEPEAELPVLLGPLEEAAVHH